MKYDGEKKRFDFLSPSKMGTTVIGNPTINISKNGYFSFNSKAVAMIGLKDKDRLMMAYDHVEKCYWVFKCPSLKDSYIIRITKHTSGFNSKKLTVDISRMLMLGLLDGKAKSVTLGISPTPLEVEGYSMYKIIKP